MKNIINLVLIAVPITSIIFHLWTSIIGFSQGGFIGGMLTLMLPFLSEFYWMFKMWNVNDLYVYLGIFQIIGVLIYSIFNPKN